MIDIKFEGIDSWNRPVFKDTNSRRRYGSITELMGNSIRQSQNILKGITIDDLCYFGTSFDCEPDGNVPTDIIRIIK